MLGEGQISLDRMFLAKVKDLLRNLGRGLVCRVNVEPRMSLKPEGGLSFEDTF